MRPLLIFLVLAASGVQIFAQNTTGPPTDSEPEHANEKQWSFSFATYGYIVPHDQSYVSPIFGTDHRHLHLEARFNYENQNTGSLWVGYNLSGGHKLTFEATPMLGAVLGNTTGIAPGYKASVSYKKVSLSTEGEFVYDTRDREESFFYSWNELTYSPLAWLHAGLVAQRTRAYHTSLDVQRGFSAGVTFKRADFTTYVFNAGWTEPTVVFAVSFKF